MARNGTFEATNAWFTFGYGAAADLPEKDGLERAVPRLLEPGRGGAALMRSAAR